MADPSSSPEHDGRSVVVAGALYLTTSCATACLYFIYDSIISARIGESDSRDQILATSSRTFPRTSERKSSSVPRTKSLMS
ncbi:hypothetical protein ACFX12_028452 [Malus domestica]